MTTNTPDTTRLSESKARNLAGAAFHFLTAEMLELKPMRVSVSVATDTYESIDDMVSLIRSKLEPGTLTLWAVDSADPEIEGVTICITGNNAKGEDHAKWIATMWANMPMVLDHMDALLTENRTLAADLARAEAERDRYREALEWYADPNNIDEEFGHGRWQDISSAGVWEDADWFPDGGERARAALNGGTDAE